ncbi:MAG: methylenetetrahydrofolate reductase [Acidobacteriota bacterium]|nr:methylenetetrahydrofolate reductase [Acidobacteriota bacterium]
MRVDHLLREGLTRSFEFFPPKSDEESAVLETTLSDLEPLKASFVSVTYRGGAASRQRTFDLVTRVQRESELSAMAHVICVGHTRAEMRDLLTRYREAGVENLMALGGDVPDDPSLIDSDFTYASELVELAREVGDFAIGVGAHPLGHPRSPDLTSDRTHLAAKLSRADFAVTQFFFRASDYVRLVEELAALGVTKPVIPGIMPVTTMSGVGRMAAMGAAVPDELAARLSRAHARGGAAAVRAEGVRAASELCAELLTLGVPGLHFYTLNRSTAMREIHRTLFGV